MSLHCVFRNLPFFSHAAFPAILQQPVSLFDLPPGSKAVFSVRATNARSYRWLHDGKMLHNSDRYLGAQTAALQILGVRETDEGRYLCIVWNELSLQTDEAILTVCKYNYALS